MPSRSTKSATNGKARANGSPAAHATTAPERLEVMKTYKLAIDGKFPRSESGRTMLVSDAAGGVIAHASKASRKDLRDAVEAARKAQTGWAAATAYLRGQILYRIAEMLEGRRAEFRDLLAIQDHRGAKSAAKTPAKTPAKTQAKTGTKPPSPAAPLLPDAEVSAAVDRLVHYAGWADKYAQVLGCNNPVAGPHYNFTVPEPTGVVGIICPDTPALLALVSLLAPVICSGNTAVLLGSQTNPLAAAVFAEACLTGDVPAGVINVLTGERAELLSHFATHREIDAVHAANLSAAEMTTLREGVAENLKRVILRGGGKAGTLDFTNAPTCESPRWIEDFVEMKTIWHPAGV